LAYAIASKWGANAGLQVVGEKDGGILSGLKIFGTGAILADEILFGNFHRWRTTTTILSAAESPVMAAAGIRSRLRPVLETRAL
jgi:hypothetical protein